MAKDPICQMDVDESAALKAERGGQTYYFYSEQCRSTFLAEDEQRPTHREHHEHGYHTVQIEEAPAIAATYFCPMCVGVESGQPFSLIQPIFDCKECGPRASSL